MDLAEAVCFSTSLTDSDADKVEGYLAEKWGLRGLLPADHTYKSSLPPAVNWDGSTNIATLQSTGSISTGLTGLTTNTSYFFRMKATNAGGTTWSDAYAFRTGTVALPPAIITAPVSNVATTSVTTAGNLLSYDGNDQPTVTIYYDSDEAASRDVPKAFGNLKLWLDANDTANMDTGYAAGSSPPANNGQVGFWKDKSGNNNHAVAVSNSSGNRPTYLANGFTGSRPTLHFNGKYMAVTNSASGFDGWDKMTVFVVVDEQANQVWRYWFGKVNAFNTDTGNAWSFRARRGDTNPPAYGFRIHGTSASDNIESASMSIHDPAIMVFTFGQGKRTMHLNNAILIDSPDSGSLSSNNSVPLTIGGLATAASGANLHISEFIAYNEVVAGIDREIMEGYLAHKWGLTSSLPDGHLYKTSAPTTKTPLTSASIGQKPTGAFTHNLTGLTAGKLYHYRFKATNNGGSGYSDTNSFVTIGTPTIKVTGATDVTPTSVTLNTKIESSGGVSFQVGAPFSPSTVTGMMMWMDGNDHNGDGTADTTTANITSWTDKSGNARHADSSQGDPQFKAGILNGLGVIDFDNNDILWQSNDAKSMYNDAEQFSMFAVSRYTGTDSERVIASADNWNWLFAGNGQKANRVAHLNGWVHPIDNTYPDDNNDWHLYQVTISNQDRANTWLDAVQYSVGHTGANNTNYRPKRMQFNGWDRARGQTNRELSQCQIAEFIAINRVVSEPERLKIEGYLARKWGLMNTMFTASHPYFSTDPFQPTVTQGGENATVTFYWGDNNGSSNPANWDNNVQLPGTHGVGVVSKTLTGLTKGTTYFYTTKVNNSGGNVWGEVKSFVPANTALNKDTIPDLALWLDATDINGDGNADSISDGTALSSWTDKSNSPAISVSRGTASSKPIYKTGAFGTRSGVHFDGINDFLAAAPVRTSAGGYHVFIASQRPSNGLGDSGSYLLKESGWFLSPGSGNGLYAPFVSKKSAEIGATLTNLKIGRDTANSSYDFGGDMGEIMIFTRKLGLTEEQKVEGYLAHKWRGAASLPSNHPYKDVAPVFLIIRLSYTNNRTSWL